jgi:hypothetical protein
MSSHRSKPHPPPFPTRALVLLAVSIVVAACSPGDGEATAFDMATLEWSSACLELWAGDDLIATSSVNRAHDGEWYERRTTEYFCEMALPRPPTITWPALPAGEYELCGQGRTDCEALSVPSGLSSTGMQLLLQLDG